MKIPSSQRQPLNKTNQGGGAMEEMSFSGETEWGVCIQWDGEAWELLYLCRLIP